MHLNGGDPFNILMPACEYCLDRESNDSVRMKRTLKERRRKKNKFQLIISCCAKNVFLFSCCTRRFLAAFSLSPSPCCISIRRHRRRRRCLRCAVDVSSCANTPTVINLISVVAVFAIHRSLFDRCVCPSSSRDIRFKPQTKIYCFVENCMPLHISTLFVQAFSGKSLFNRISRERYAILVFGRPHGYWVRAHRQQSPRRGANAFRWTHESSRRRKRTIFFSLSSFIAHSLTVFDPMVETVRLVECAHIYQTRERIDEKPFDHLNCDLVPIRFLIFRFFSTAASLLLLRMIFSWVNLNYCWPIYFYYNFDIRFFFRDFLFVCAAIRIIEFFGGWFSTMCSDPGQWIKFDLLEKIRLRVRDRENIK